MKNLPKISIILGGYKEEKIIGDTLKHLATEIKYPNLEIIAAIDTHNDKTIDIARKYAKKYKKIKIDFSPKRRGVTKALASALKKATGDIILHAGSEYRYHNPATFLFKLVKYYDDPTVGGVTIEGEDPKSLDKQRRGNINEYSQVALYRVVRDWRNQHKIIQGNVNFPVICHSFRRKLITDLDTESINDDAEFAFSVLDKGYKIVSTDGIQFYSMVETTTPGAILLRQTRTTAGWLKIARKRKMNLFKFYLSVFWYFITHIYRYSFYEVVSTLYAIPLFLISVINGYIKQKKSATKIWKTYERSNRHEKNIT
jgi:glycosyltransferase involved in cell wall biosynthesis